jgi:hypothetical protein
VKYFTGTDRPPIGTTTYDAEVAIPIAQVIAAEEVRRLSEVLRAAQAWSCSTVDWSSPDLEPLQLHPEPERRLLADLQRRQDPLDG